MSSGSSNAFGFSGPGRVQQGAVPHGAVQQDAAPQRAVQPNAVQQDVVQQVAVHNYVNPLEMPCHCSHYLYKAVSEIQWWTLKPH